MLTIWGRLNSHNVKKVAWFAQELALPFVRHDVGGQFGMDAAYRALNPNALIPTIEDDGLVLWESNAILRYLASRYGDSRFWHPDPAVRAAGDKWMDWQFAFADAQRDAFYALVRQPAADRDAVRIARSAETAGHMMAIVNATFAEQPWLSGEAFGVADVPMGVYAHTWHSLEIARPDLPHVARWYARLCARPAFREQVMIPLT